MMQSGAHSANVGPFLSDVESKMVYDSAAKNDAGILPNDWSAVMGQFFQDDAHVGQNCKICDATGSTISFLKFARDPNSVFTVSPVQMQCNISFNLPRDPFGHVG